ncbi:pectate lyase [Dactylosporangium sp. AC04546]|uniref:pectate lyase family protein n=1 Tax=Dactylosporangium sp. AC04546 TaxID=2862460 RepID=UPI001EE003B9|nr:pectate lyase [Dactylosporangium sp. AC04546]WVK89222.1 pectate lyase [Dactylosporangium sp. AC04546]
MHVHLKLGLTVLTVAGLTLAAATAIAQAADTRTTSVTVPAQARQPLAANDGWGAAGAGTTGGSAADDAHVFVVRTRDELVAAVAGNTPKIVLVAGKIDANAGKTCADYADPAYSLDAYLAAYDPAVWGRVAPSGPLEEARVRSTRTQGEQIKVNVGSNTTIYGLKGAQLLAGNLLLTNVSNVIIRNMTFVDAADCFPAWTPTDGAEGNWNSLYDNVTLSGATNVWLDHNTFTDGANQDVDQPVYFGRPYQVHDGLADIIRGSDYVTVSYNYLFEHDKSMLIGSTNTPGVDVGKLRVTIHHNRFANLGQRIPRVRFGQVDVYNNYFYLTDEDTFSYAFGVGVQSAIYAENNFVLRSADIPLGNLVYNWGGTVMTERGTLARVGTGPIVAVNLLAEFNAASDPDIGTDAGWTPALRAGLDPTADVPKIVTANAGARLPV